VKGALARARGTAVDPARALEEPSVDEVAAQRRVVVVKREEQLVHLGLDVRPAGFEAVGEYSSTTRR
jgi:hypothetical protein